jgi:tetratricopeptide (TPR) repeat protein
LLPLFVVAISSTDDGRTIEEGREARGATWKDPSNHRRRQRPAGEVGGEVVAHELAHGPARLDRAAGVMRLHDDVLEAEQAFARRLTLHPSEFIVGSTSGLGKRPMDSPAQSAHVFGNDNIVVQASGSGVNVAIGPRPYLRLTQYERQTKLAARDNSEAALLSAYRADVVPLIGRDDAMADLRRWLDDTVPVSVRVLIGAGGRGKTRLALELARDMAKGGWLAGFATADALDRFRGQHGVEQWRWDKPVLVILDDAASRAHQLGAWVRELVDASLEGRPKLRLLLLERQADRKIGWLSTVFGQGANDDSRAAIELLDPKEPVELPALGELEFRRRVFGALLKKANGALEAPARGADPEFDRLLADLEWASDPLYLMMAALEAAKSGVWEALRLPRGELAIARAVLELDRIGGIGASRGIEERRTPSGFFVRHLAVCITLMRGMKEEEALALAEQERPALGSAASPGETTDVLKDALGPAAGAESASNRADAVVTIAAIRPDVVGEAAVVGWFGGAKSAPSRVVKAEDRILSIVKSAPAKAIETLARAAEDFDFDGDGAPSGWVTLVARAHNDDLDVQSVYAEWLARLSERSSAGDKNEDALQAAREAVEIFRRLAVGDDRFLGSLAQVLHQVLAQLHKLAARGRLVDVQEFVEPIYEVVEVARRVASKWPKHGVLAFARSLEAASSSLIVLERRDDAIGFAEEAASIYGGLVDDGRIEFLSDLARSLTTAGTLLSETKRPDAALGPLRKAVAVHRRVASVQPDALPGLAESLGRLSQCLSAAGHVDEAHPAAREATEIYRRLATDFPDDGEHTRYLALALAHLTGLSELGQSPELLEHARQTVEAHRRAAAKFSTFVPALAAWLHTLGSFLLKAGEPNQALDPLQEAVCILRRLAAETQGLESELASALTSLSYCLADLDRRDHAYAATREALALLGTPFLKSPGEHFDLMSDLLNLYLDLSGGLSVEPDEALIGPIEEALNSIRPFSVPQSRKDA